MAWPKITLRARRIEVRDDVASSLPGADASIPNTVLREMGDAQASLTNDNDAHLDWVARMMMPDTAEGEFVDRWANIWLPNGRKEATFAIGLVTITGQIGAVVPTGALFSVQRTGDDGAIVRLQFAVDAGVTLTGTSANVAVTALSAGAMSNLGEGQQVAFVDVPDDIDGSAVVAAPGFAGGGDIEPDDQLIDRYIDRIQQPPHGGNANDYAQWAREVPGVTRAWQSPEMGVGTITVRFMMDEVRVAQNGLPQAADLALVKSHIDNVRPVTVAESYYLSPILQPETVTITALANDTPEVRANIALEVNAMLRARAKPGATIYASWVRESISAATGEDHHGVTISDFVPASAGHLITIDIQFA